MPVIAVPPFIKKQAIKTASLPLSFGIAAYFCITWPLLRRLS
jgi:hypothetical protein